MSDTIRSVVMDLLKTEFGGYTLWSRIETDLALLVSDLPDASKEDNKEEIIVGLKKIKQFLIDKEIPENNLLFLDEEIDRYDMTKQISLYEESEDWLDDAVSEKYAKMGFNSEGIVGIHLPLSYEQLKKLTNAVYKKTGLIKFYISKEQMIYGKVVAEIYDFAQTIPIATLLQSKKEEDEKPNINYIALFGEKINNIKYNVVKEINSKLFVYRFISENQRDYILLNHEKLELGDYIIQGVVTDCNDHKVLTDSAKITTKLPFFFAQSAKSRIIHFKDHQEFFKRVDYLGLDKNGLFDYPFSLKIKDKRVILNQPTWFKWMIWAWLTHESVGLFNPYPLHIMVLGPAQSGKSLMLNAMHEKSREARQVFSGVSSTLKGLVPSFREKPAKAGYLAESTRFSFCDEFLRCLINTHSGKDNNLRDESVGIMNDLLEHQKREAGSGVSKINVNMTSRVLATSNPVKGVHSMNDLLNKFDMAFLSRWLVYFQDDSHINMIRESRDNSLQCSSFDISVNDWVSFLDYLQSFSAKYDLDRVLDIKASCEEVLNHDIKEHYDARHKHHIQCLMDGLVKARCFLNKDYSFKANDLDYKRLETIWKSIINSWIDPEMVKNLPVDQRRYYLPENAQWLYEEVCKTGRPLSRIETEEIGLKEFSKSEYVKNMLILLDNRLLQECDGIIKPYWMKEK